MLPWVTVEEARAKDGTRLTLVRRGTEWEVHADDLVLMESRSHGSEDDLARLAFARVPHAKTVLLGGLGLGFSLRATLDLLGPHGRVVLAEQSPAVVEWNRTHVAALAGRPLDDPRVTTQIGDVRASIAEARGAYDLILLDVDNGPESLIHEANAHLYDATGVVACHVALRTGGALAVWATASNERYLRRLTRSGFEAAAIPVRRRPGAGGRKHFVFVAVKAGPSREPSSPSRRGA